MGWPYGDKPTFVLTSRKLPRIRASVEFYSGDLGQFVNGRLRPTFRTIWFIGGGAVCAECLRLGLADEVSRSKPATSTTNQGVCAWTVAAVAAGRNGRKASSARRSDSLVGEVILPT